MRKGFTLIEVVLACTILILFLMAGLILFGTGIRNIKIAQHRLEAIYWANDYVNCLQSWRDGKYFSGTAFNLNPGDLSGATCNAIGAPYSRTLSNAEIPGILANDGERVGVTISWTDFGRSYNVLSFVYLTKWQN